MALKFKIAGCLAISTGLLTVFLAFLYGVRAITIVYRGVFTTVLFFVVGYIIGIFTENYLKKLLENDAHKGKNVDITDKADSDILFTEDALGEVASPPEFKPLNPESFMSLSSTQK